MYEGLKVYLVSHTHWDREWYMSLQPSTERFIKLMDRLLVLLENELEFKSFHMDGQVLPVLDYLEMRPEKREQLSLMV
jgi:alpha-mannosidase